MIEARISLGYGDKALAEAVHLSTLPDNGPFVSAELSGSTILFRTRAESASSLRHTLDDLLSCVKAAEEAFTAGGCRRGP